MARTWGSAIVDALAEAAAVAGIDVSDAAIGQVSREPSGDVAEDARRLGIPVREVDVRGDWRDASGPHVLTRGDAAVAVVPSGRVVQVVTAGGPSADWPFDADRAWAITPRVPPQKGTLSGLIRTGLGGSATRESAWLVTLAAASAALGLAVPLWAGAIIGELVPLGSTSRIEASGVVLTCVALLIAALTYAQALAVQRLAARISATTVAVLIDRVVRLPLYFFRGIEVGSIVQRIQGLDAASAAVANSMLRIVSGLALAIAGTVVMFVFDGQLALVVSAILLILTLVAAWVLRRQYIAQRGFVTSQLRLSGMSLSMLSGVAKIRAAGAESRMGGIWEDAYAGQQAHAATVARGTQRIALLTALAPIAVTAAVVLGSVDGIEHMDLGAFTVFVTAATQTATSAAATLSPLAVLFASIPLAAATIPLLDAQPDPTSSTLSGAPLEGTVEISHVSFTYGDAEVLHDITLHAAAGEMIAIVGPSGSGKSTLLRVLLGLERPSSGEVLFDGRPLDRLGADAVRRKIGVVTQDGRLAGGTLLQNIVGSSGHTEDEAWLAAELAGVADDIRAMPMAMQTVVSDGAATFSGGQRQRILLARALVRQPPILVLDEATSALDPLTQAAVARSMEASGATRIVVAHRLSTIRRADRIYVLDRGTVVEEGPFDSLMMRSGLFASLAAPQL